MCAASACLIDHHLSQGALVSSSKTRTVRAEVDEAVEFEWLSPSLYLYIGGDYRSAIRELFHLES